MVSEVRDDQKVRNYGEQRLQRLGIAKKLSQLASK